MHWLTVTMETFEPSDFWPGLQSKTGKPVIFRKFTRRTELYLTMFTNKIAKTHLVF
jgi:hypothetical protein